MLNILKNWKNQQTAASNLERYTKEDILKGKSPNTSPLSWMEMAVGLKNALFPELQATMKG